MIQARLVGLTVRGFRCFQEPVSFTLTEPNGRPLRTLVVAGPNGLGKTAFLEAVLYTLGRERWFYPTLDEEHWRHWFQLAFTSTFCARLELDVVSAPGTMLGTFTPCRLEVIRSRASWSVRVDRAGSLALDDEVGVRRLLAQVPVAWFSAERRSCPMGPVRPLAADSTALRGEAGNWQRVKQRIVDECFRAVQDQILKRDLAWVERLNRARWALRGHDGTQLTLVPVGQNTWGSRWDLLVQRLVPGSEEVDVCSVDQLSSGEREWLALAGTLITTDFDGILLIDTPELHLGSEWQALLLPALRGVVPESQLILASQSDALWDQVYSFERVLLVPPGDPRVSEGKE